MTGNTYTAGFLLVLVLAGPAVGKNLNGPSLSTKSRSGSLGIVDPIQRCGGIGTPIEFRISDCNGRCQFHPGYLYNCEYDFIPSSSVPSLSLMLEICLYTGFCSQIINTEIPNSSVQPGITYTAKYSLVPNDILSGQAIRFRAELYHTRGSFVEVCVEAEADILEVGK